MAAFWRGAGRTAIAGLTLLSLATAADAQSRRSHYPYPQTCRDTFGVVSRYAGCSAENYRAWGEGYGSASERATSGNDLSVGYGTRYLGRYNSLYGFGR